MRRHRGRVVDLGSLDELDARLAAGTTSLSGWRVRGVDLSERGEAVLGRRVAGALFLGCTFAPGDAERLGAAGALVLPALADVPLDVYRAGLYTAADLYDAPRYADSLDARAYAWSQQRGGPDDSLAKALHDHAIDEALTAWVAGRRLVGVMGGHALQRGQAGYADAARLGRLLGAGGLTVATGGGPGAMEAANLGARLSGRPEAELDAALARLAGVASYRPSVQAWAEVALEVAAGPDPVETLGIPTWHYGHEPPGVFATAIAKYFRNATRESILLEVCDAGIVFLPGAAGTVQEVFQDACENYYADESSVAPMVLVGRHHWTEELPAWPLLESLARGRTMPVALVDSVEEAAAVVLSRPSGRR